MFQLFLTLTFLRLRCARLYTVRRFDANSTHPFTNECVVRVSREYREYPRIHALHALLLNNGNSNRKLQRQSYTSSFAQHIAMMCDNSRAWAQTLQTRVLGSTPRVCISACSGPSVHVSACIGYRGPAYMFRHVSACRGPSVHASTYLGLLWAQRTCLDISRLVVGPAYLSYSEPA